MIRLGWVSLSDLMLGSLSGWIIDWDFTVNFYGTIGNDIYNKL